MTLGIDPHSAKPYGYALYERGVVVQYGCATLVEVHALMGAYDLDLVAIEDQYMNRNYKVAKALSVSAGKVAGLAEVAGVRVAFANVASWKSKAGAQGGRHVEVVRERYGLEASDDEASAILIAEYAEKYLTE